MPDDDDTAALEKDESWRFVQGLQLFFLIVIFIYMSFFVKYDSPKFYVTQREEEKAKEAIS